MVKCKICEGNCDNGELIGGVCLECIEEERQRQMRADTVARMLNSPSEQLGLELVI